MPLLEVLEVSNTSNVTRVKHVEIECNIVSFTLTLNSGWAAQESCTFVGGIFLFTTRCYDSDWAWMYTDQIFEQRRVCVVTLTPTSR